MQGLTPRLAAVAAFVLPGAPMADIGTDHAYLPVALVATGTVPRAVATDLRPGPLSAARVTIDAAGLAARVETRLGSGLAALRGGDVATVVLAGMGGPLIADLLAAAPAAVLAGVRRLVLQPMAGEAALRRRLPELGWRIVDEDLVADGGRLYLVIVAAPAGPGAYTAPGDELDALLGPVLRRRRGKLFAAYARSLAARLARAARAAESARNEAGRARAGALRAAAERVRQAAEEAEG